MNEDDARKIFGSDANIEKLRPFKMNGGEVDFGDDLHLGGVTSRKCHCGLVD
jgi:hypothetical protein